MVKAKRPFLSLLATGRLGKHFRVVSRQHRQVIQASPDPPDVKSLAQLSWRHMYQKAVALWHALSAAEKLTWEATGTVRHMTGFAWFMSQCLKPNPGLYLPLQGGTMTGEIIMGGEVISDLPDPANPQDADTQAARDAAITAALADCIDSHIHGWDGADWQKLRVESSTLHNLRVRLYDGANGIGSVVQSATVFPNTLYGIVTASGLYSYEPTQGRWTSVHCIRDIGDGSAGNKAASIGLVAYNGASFDRLRSYGTGILKVGRAEVGLNTPRLVGTGQVKASAGYLYWITMNPSAGLSVMELSDDIDGSTAVVYDHFHTSRQSHHVNLDPPMPFSNGIYLKTITNMTSIMFGYL